MNGLELDETDSLAAEILNHLIVQEDIPLDWFFSQSKYLTFWDDYKNPGDE